MTAASVNHARAADIHAPSSHDLDVVAAQWARLGAGFNIEPAATTPDVERLLLNTARLAQDHARLLIMAVTWLARYGAVVARHRLCHLVVAELEPSARAVLGLLLESVAKANRTRHFNIVIEACAPAAEPGPLLAAERANDLLHERSRRRASELSRRWNLWFEPFELKADALRPTSWVIANNPALRQRADFHGDLRCSILETLRTQPEAGRSELALARLCGATRAAVRAALEKLAMAGYVLRPDVPGHRRPVVLVPNHLAS
jgi:hypothetical protein